MVTDASLSETRDGKYFELFNKLAAPSSVCLNKKNDVDKIKKIITLCNQ